MADKKYRWDNPHEWIDEKISRLAASGDYEGLANLSRSLASSLCSDDLTDTFDAEMTDDGFYKPTHCECGEEMNTNCSGDTVCPLCSPCPCCHQDGPGGDEGGGGGYGDHQEPDALWEAYEASKGNKPD